MKAFCNRCQKKQPVRDIEHLLPMGKSKVPERCHDRTVKIPLVRRGIFVECEACQNKFVYVPERK